MSGGRAVEAKKPPAPAVRVGGAHEPAEREADRLAEVLTGARPVGLRCTGCAPAAPPCPACAARAAAGGIGPVLGAGTPLPHALREKFERRLGADLGPVRLHAGSDAADAAEALGARAFTLGRHIALGRDAPPLQSRAGERLLAHEVAHTLQPDAGQVLRRDGPDAGAQAPGGDAGTSGPPDAVSEHEGIPLRNDPRELRDLVRRLVLARGLDDAAAFVRRYERETAYGIPGGIPPDLAVRPAIGAHLRAALAELESVRERFRSQASATLLAILAESEARLDLEAVRLGLPAGSPTAGKPAEQRLGDTDYAAGMAAAARDLLAIRSRLDALMAAHRREVLGLYRVSGGAEAADRILRRLPEIAPVQREYDVRLAAASLRYPILAAAAEPRGPLGWQPAGSRLAALAEGGGAAGTLAATLIEERRRNIAHVRAENAAGRVKPLKLDGIVAVTKRAQGIAPASPEDRAINDMIQAETMDEALRNLAIGAVALALGLIAAVPTGGSSLAAAGAALAALGSAGISAAMLAESIRDYELESAAARSDLDPARAIAAEDPTMFWVALDIVSLGLDIGAAARAFRALRPLARDALAARSLLEAQDAARALRAAGDAQAPGLGRKLTDTLAALRGRGSAAERALGVAGPEELRATAAAAARAEEAAAGAGGAVRRASPHGGALTVTPRGQLYTCASPCALLRERYAEQLATQPGMLAELVGIEADAAAAAGDAARMAAVAERASELEGRLRLLPVGEWRSPLAASADHAELLRRRGSAAFHLDRKPPGWTGAEEARFRFGPGAAAETGYRWVLDGDGTLRYVRMDADLPERVFDPVTGAFRAAEPRAAAVALETEEELARLAALGAGATSRADWLARIRRGVPDLQALDDATLMRVLSKSPNLDHMRGELLEALAGGPLERRAAAAGRGAEFIAGHRIRDADGRQLTDGIVIRRRPGRPAELLVIGESKAGPSAAEGLRVERTRIKDMTDRDRLELEREAIEELWRRAGAVGPEGSFSAPLPPALRPDYLRQHRRTELDAIMVELNTSEAGQVVRDFERLMPGLGEGRSVTILVDGAPLAVQASYRRTVVAATVPRDVPLASTIEAAAEAGIRVEAAAVDVTTEQLDALARQLRAEQIRNGSRFP